MFLQTCPYRILDCVNTSKQLFESKALILDATLSFLYFGSCALTLRCSPLRKISCGTNEMTIFLIKDLLTMRPTCQQEAEKNLQMRSKTRHNWNWCMKAFQLFDEIHFKIFLWDEIKVESGITKRPIIIIIN